MTGGEATRISGPVIPPGTVLNNGIYEIERVIASGGMGTVYKGRAIATDDPVAIKVIKDELAGNDMATALFRKEAAVLNRLVHDAIVRYYVFTHDPGIERFYLATEFVDGKPLSDVIHRTPLPRAEVLALAVRLAEGLEAAHRLHVFHRDISPDNVILPDGDVDRAKIIDFGIARAAAIGGGTVIGDSTAGKFEYMSPEQVGLYGGEVGAQSDVYSLGIVLAEAALGRSLAMGGTHVEVVEKRRLVPDLSGLDPGLRDLLSGMLQPKPADRLPSMTAVAEKARKLAGARGAVPGRSRWGLVAAAVAVLALLAGGLFAYETFREGADESPQVASGGPVRDGRPAQMSEEDGDEALPVLVRTAAQADRDAPASTAAAGDVAGPAQEVPPEETTVAARDDDAPLSGPNGRAGAATGPDDAGDPDPGSAAEVSGGDEPGGAATPEEAVAVAPAREDPPAREEPVAPPASASGRAGGSEGATAPPAADRSGEAPARAREPSSPRDAVAGSTEPATAGATDRPERVSPERPARPAEAPGEQVASAPSGGDDPARVEDRAGTPPPADEPAAEVAPVRDEASAPAVTAEVPDPVREQAEDAARGDDRPAAGLADAAPATGVRDEPPVTAEVADPVRERAGDAARAEDRAAAAVEDAAPASVVREEPAETAAVARADAAVPEAGRREPAAPGAALRDRILSAGDAADEPDPIREEPARPAGTEVAALSPQEGEAGAGDDGDAQLSVPDERPSAADERPSATTEPATVETGPEPGETDGTAAAVDPGTSEEFDISAIDPDSTFAPAGSPEDGVRRYLARYDAGPCTLIRPVRLAANEVRLEAFGKEAGPIQDFYQNFIRSFGFAPQVGARLVEDAQCAALDYLDEWLGRPGTLRLQLDRDVLSAGDALSGAISGLGERDLALVIVSDNGLVYSLNDMVTRNDEDAAFHTKISSTTPGGERPQLLFALASRPVPRLTSDRPMRASDFFPLLAAALEESEGVEAAVAYFKFEG